MLNAQRASNAIPTNATNIIIGRNACIRDVYARPVITSRYLHLSTREPGNKNMITARRYNVTECTTVSVRRDTLDVVQRAKSFRANVMVVSRFLFF